tara:strand:- start:1419 stop:1943 length:525 start_codon:yes stop_codon:yes gene_type:complete
MTLKTLAISILTILISGCSLLGTKEVEIVSKPVQIDIIQPTLPREINLQNPKWYVVSEAIITNPCIKRLQDDGSMKRPKSCLPEDRENPDWPEGYTYLDRFLDEMKKLNGGDVVFVATTIGDYEMMSANMQEIRRYIRELGEVIVYYRNVTLPDGQEGVGIEVKVNETKEPTTD